MKTFTFLLAFIFLALPPAGAAVSVGNVTQNESDGTDTVSFPHDSNGNYLGVCTVNTFGQSVSGNITFNGVALSPKTSETHGGSIHEFWEMVGPASGSHNIAFTLDASAGNIRTAVISFLGVDQASPSGTAATKAGGDGGGTSAVSVTVPANGAAMDCFTVNGNSHSLTAGAGQTQRTTSPNGDNQNHASSTSLDAGTNSMNWTWTTDDNYNTLIAVPLNAAATATGRRAVVVE
jgi:hypothetical protein